MPFIVLIFIFFIFIFIIFKLCFLHFILYEKKYLINFLLGNLYYCHFDHGYCGKIIHFSYYTTLIKDHCFFVQNYYIAQDNLDYNQIQYLLQFKVIAHDAIY